MEEQTDRPAWIMDGNYGGTMDIRLEKADLIIFMDRSRWLCLYRILKRQLQYIGRTRPDMTEGCVERVSWEFVQYVYRYNDTRRPGILEKLEGYEKEKQVFILKNENQIKRFLLNIAEV
jgi:adenylate kinase family enzyme